MYTSFACHKRGSGETISGRDRLFVNWSVGVGIRGFESSLTIPLPNKHMSQLMGMPPPQFIPNGAVKLIKLRRARDVE